MNEPRRSIWCCACNADVMCRLTSGAEVYPHRPDLHVVPMWKCDGCKGSVGTHHKRKGDPLSPLGVIATPELRDARQRLHGLIDPLWRSGRFKRGQLYARISLELGREYHTGELRSLEDARVVWRIVKAIIAEADGVTKEDHGS